MNPRLKKAFSAALELDGRSFYAPERLLTSRVRRDVAVRRQALAALVEVGWTYEQLQDATGLRSGSIRQLVRYQVGVDISPLLEHPAFKEARPPDFD